MKENFGKYLLAVDGSIPGADTAHYSCIGGRSNNDVFVVVGKGGEAVEQAVKQKAAADQRRAEDEVKLRAIEEKKQREELERLLAEQRQREADTRRALEQEQVRRREAERIAKEAPARGQVSEPEEKPKKGARAPFVGGF